MPDINEIYYLPTGPDTRNEKVNKVDCFKIESARRGAQVGNLLKITIVECIFINL